MPELPEVETTLRGIAPHLDGRLIQGAVVRNGRLRLPVNPDLAQRIGGQRVRRLQRRAKYLIIELENGALLIHLGMSGTLRAVPADTPPQPHDHVDILLDRGHCLRLRDPRRFGLLLWVADWRHHPLMRSLGPEPFADDFSGAYLHQRSRSRRQAIKSFIMDAGVVVGVGNIYANEALFQAGIHPARPAGSIGRTRYERLAAAIRGVLMQAIAAGGTTLRDYADPSGKAGYFVLSLQVYDREGRPCLTCGSALRQARIGQRSSFFCVRCQR